jgi:hypothetical protein
MIAVADWVPGSAPGLNCKSRYPAAPSISDVLIVTRYDTELAEAEGASKMATKASGTNVNNA